ncbi:MAG: MFS transporter [Alicyclobacillus macrosporangiidus]|uniref:MFS transporter n=1 Tax=Alicyclobacillus macrosporangiidus TaxID=392015 RepID=UPI0026F14551|nr:MFS transporter [Alicyclobacillus macrosporangiidus]MCL6600394.1 MFS transporter [Alicyclobacillus macrosporangiidus]
MRDILLLMQTETEYRRLLFASLISGLGDWFNSVALLSLLLHLTGSGFAVGLTLAVRTLPYLVMGPIGGILADRFNRKTILLVSDFARAILALSFLFIHDASEVWIAYAGTFGLVVFSALFSPARTAVIPQLVQADHVSQANGLEQSTSGLVMAVGAALGGIVTAALGTQVAFITNAASFLVSGLLCWSIQIPNDHLHRRSQVGTGPSSTQAVRKISFWSVFWRSRLVQVIALQSLLWPIGGGAVNVLLSVYGYQVFHSGNTGVGVMYGALGLGFLLSGFLIRRFTAWTRQAAVVGFLIEGLCHILVSQSPSLWLTSICLVLATVGAGVGNASVITLIMQTVTKEVHGRVFAMFDTTSSVTIAASMMATGVLLNHVPVRTIGFSAGLLIVTASVVTGIPLLRTELPPKACKPADDLELSPSRGD